jgi:excisionase family DNA binding protein
MLISLKHLRRQYLPDLSEAFLYQLAHAGKIPAVRVGDRWLFDPVAVIDQLKAKGSQPATRGEQ